MRPRWRGVAVAAVLLSAALTSHVVSLARPQAGPAPGPEPASATNVPANQEGEVRVRFDQAVVMLHAKEYDNAAIALQRVLELVPTLPEAHVNMGYALLGLQQFEAARQYFDAAVGLRPMQANAYYGLALAAEGRHDLPSAIGAMRAFLHLSHADHPHRARARAAIWEWEAALGGTETGSVPDREAGRLSSSTPRISNVAARASGGDTR